jgi:hypothetical protein
MDTKETGRQIGEYWLEGKMLHYVSTEGEVKISVGIKTRVLRSLISQKTDEMTVFFELLEAQADEENIRRVDELEIAELAKVVSAWQAAIEEYTAKESRIPGGEAGE